MHVVFVIDTSPSMGEKILSSSSSSASSEVKQSGSSNIQRLDLAKCICETLAKGLDRRIQEHNHACMMASSGDNVNEKKWQTTRSASSDQYLLLSTGRQEGSVSSAGASGLLLVGFPPGVYASSAEGNANNIGDNATSAVHLRNHASFERELKRLKATPIPSVGDNFPEGGGGVVGLNMALSFGFQLLSRFRLHHRKTENFGMGRFPNSNNLQPAILILLTDGECLSKPPNEGGGALTLQFGNAPLREFYREPFRWDQRFFCITVGNGAQARSLHPSLSAFCDVTGGSHHTLSEFSQLMQVTDALLKDIAPQRPTKVPIMDPLRLPGPSKNSPNDVNFSSPVPSFFVNGGPICSFQCMGEQPLQNAVHRAMILLEQFCITSGTTGPSRTFNVPPLWCIPENFFPSKKMDTLPPRPAQPLLYFSRQFHGVGSNTFDPTVIMKYLSRLDHIYGVIRAAITDTGNDAKCSSGQKVLHRDVYVCKWLGHAGGPRSHSNQEHFPVYIRGGGRPSLSEGGENILNIGILHSPQNAATNCYLDDSHRSSKCATALYSTSTLTLLPPEPHILLPLLLRAAEQEYRMVKRAAEPKDKTAATSRKGATASIIKQQGFIDTNPGFVNLDDHWRTEFRAYLFRIPPYYQQSIRRCLRPLLPQSVHTLFAAESIDVIASQCFSRACLQKIRSGENIMKDHNERIDRQEEELRRHKIQSIVPECDGGQKTVGYGQFDPRASVSAYLAALRNLPPPWRSGHMKNENANAVDVDEKLETRIARIDQADATIVLGDLPADCLLAYYESRRRWIFGGTGLATKGLCVEGANYGGNNAHKYARDHKVGNESLLALSGVGASTLNNTTISKMGNFRERLLWSRSPVVGYGCNDSAGSAATTAPDGSSTWSVDDDVLPGPFFDPNSGDFVDSIQTRLHARLSINFGNPYKSKRGNCVIPEKFQSQRRPRNMSGSFDDNEDKLPQTPQGSPPHGLTSPPHTLGSPPHDSFSVPAEGEGEAVFAGKPSTPRFSHNEPGKTATIKTSNIFHKKKANKSSAETPPPSRKDGNQRSKSTGKPRPPPPPPKGPPTLSNQSRKNTSPRQHQKKEDDTPKSPSAPAAHEQKPPAPSRKEKPPAPAKVEKPPAPARLDDPKKRKLQQQPHPPPPDLQNPNIKPNVNLAHGWITVWSKSQKRWYFFDTKTNKSVWQWPPP